METRFFHPKTIDEAVAVLRDVTGAVIVNGGSDIVPNLSSGRIEAPAIVFVQDINEMKYVTCDGGLLHIGGSVTYRQMQSAPACRAIAGLMKAIACMGSPAIRNVGMPAGNIAAAAPAADCATMLLALNTQLVLKSVRGERIAAQKDLYCKAFQTSIARDELICELRFPLLGAQAGTGFARYSRRAAQDVAKVIVGALVRLDQDGRCVSASVSMGALNAIPVLAPSISQGIVGLNRQEAVAFALRVFPKEAGLRESYFKQYKEETTCSAVAEAVDMAFSEAERGGPQWHS